MSGIERTLRAIVDLLVQKDYVGLERLTNGIRLSAGQIESGINEYGRTLVFPPAEAFIGADVIAIRGTSPQAYSITLHLHTMEEGKSDLELRATLIENPHAELMTVELDDLLVA